MGKIISAIVTFIICCSPISFSASYAADAVSGTRCTKAGTTKVINLGTKAKKYTCKKVAKTLKWSNPTALPDLTLDNLDPTRVRDVAYQEMTRELNAQKPYLAPVTYVNGPNVDETSIKREQPGLTRSMKFWGDIYSPKKVFISYVTGYDGLWVDKALCERANNCQETLPSAHIWGPSIKNNTSVCTFGEATATNDSVPLLVQCIGPGNENVQNLQTGPHEYAHLVQQAYTTIFANQPRWFIEGSAVYFGGVLGVHSSKGIPSTLNYILRFDAVGWKNQKLCPVSSTSIEEIVNCINFSYLKNGTVPAELRWQISSTSYYPGSLITEAMVAIYGVPKIKSFISKLRIDNFDQAFQETFGSSVNEFYPKAAKYVKAMYDKGM